MKEIDLAKLFLKTADVPEDLIVKKAYGKTPQWDSLFLIETLIKYSSADAAKEVLGASKDTINTYASKFLSKIIKTPKGQRTWSIAILDYIQYKLCTKCGIFKHYSEYHTTSTKQVGVTTFCKECNNKYDKGYYASHVQESVAKNALYRSNKIKATPKWANIQAISEFYNSCPKGWHVDHIIPLKGKNVCGLHVVSNLQYLSAKDNISKGNKFS